MIRTVAPLVMAVCASDSSVWSLPCAFCTVNCEEDMPAAVSAWVRYGASNWTYRAEVTVSGRRTATLPLPAVVRGFRVDIAAKSRVNWATEIETVAPLELGLLELLLPLEGEEEELLLLQAAAARHKATDADTATAPFLAIRII
jgi:hypothetical protein